MSAQMRSPHSSRVVDMREASFQQFSPTPQQLFASLAPNASPVPIDRRLLPWFPPPLPTLSFRLRQIRPHSDLSEILHHRAAMIALVRHHLFQPVRVHPLISRWFLAHFLQLLRRLDERFLHRRRVSSISSLQRHRHHRSRLQIHRVLRLVRQVRPPIFHLRDPRILIVRVLPIFVRSLLLSLPVQPRQIFPRRRFDPRLLRQFRQKLRVALSAVPPHDASQRRIRFPRRRVDSQRLAFQQSLLRDHSQHPREDFPVRFNIDQPPRPRDRRVIRRHLLQPDPQKPSQPQRVRCPPRPPALPVQPLEVPDQQQPKVHPRRQTWPPHLRRVKPPAPLFHEAIKSSFLPPFIQSLIKRMPRRSRQTGCRYPQLFLLFWLFPCAHRHVAILRFPLPPGNNFRQNLSQRHTSTTGC